MPKPDRGIALFGKVVAPRSGGIRSVDGLHVLTTALDAAYGSQRMADFGSTQEGEVHGLLTIDADPLPAILWAMLGTTARPMRWAVAAGRVDAGHGPATERTGAAIVGAREALSRAGSMRDAIVIVSGDPTRDPLLDDLGPVLAALLADLTDRQREIARLILVDGLRQSDVAARLRISRPTVSVAVGRARLREISRLASAIRSVFASGVSATLVSD